MDAIVVGLARFVPHSADCVSLATSAHSLRLQRWLLARSPRPGDHACLLHELHHARCARSRFAA